MLLIIFLIRPQVDTIIKRPPNVKYHNVCGAQAMSLHFDWPCSSLLDFLWEKIRISVVVFVHIYNISHQFVAQQSSLKQIPYFVIINCYSSSSD